jgi:hypothetical protein
MKLKTLGLLCVVALVGCGVVEEGVGAEELGTNEQALTSSACCTVQAGSGYTEAFCDSVGYSAGRCNQVWGGTACTWLSQCGSNCCVPQTDLSQSSYCASLNSFGSARCNAVWGGTRCMWACP